MQYTIVDDNVEVAPIYRCDGKAIQPTRPSENHGLAIEHLPTWTESRSKLGIASECVYTTFFWTPTSHTLRQLSEDVLFGRFVIALNAAFTQQLSLADEGYESGSDTVELPTPLRKIPRIHHMSSMEHASFSPAYITPHSTVIITHHSSP